ncbi:MAG: SufS family cysteine desulfurase [Bacteroidetes bacterium]|nr:SufS family cysteine desulfurase [Bacteroidota bacterium]
MLDLTAISDARIRADFPTLRQEVYGHPLVYLDSAASSLKPQCVIDCLANYYTNEHSNVHRGVHYLSQRATERYEASRQRLAKFIGASSEKSIVFTRGTTEAINLVASTFGRKHIRRGDEILTTVMEHHSNLVPWQLLAQERGARLRVSDVLPDGTLDLDAFVDQMNDQTRLITLGHVSNSLGTLNPVEQIIKEAHTRGIAVLLDGAQGLPHLPLNMEALNCDFYCASSHKAYGPTGIGFLYGRQAILEELPPWHGGGDMIEEVHRTSSTWADVPHKFEAGTPNIAGVIGMAAAIDYIDDIGIEYLRRKEKTLLQYAHSQVNTVPGLRIVGTSPEKIGVLSFLLEGKHPYDVGYALDQTGIAVRTGHHCTMPLMEHLGIPGTVRASLGAYNTKQDIDLLVTRLKEIVAGPRTHTGPTSTGAHTRTNGNPPNEETIQSRKTAILEDMELFDDADGRREYLIELGEDLPAMRTSLKTEANRIHGCLAMVWLHSTVRNGRIYFEADSDALITRGMIALLIRLMDGQLPRSILETDLIALINDVGLPSLITARRKNGLNHMVARIQREALLAETT